MEDSFTYELTGKQEDLTKIALNELLYKKFIYKSVVKSLKNTEKDVEYFRDIGLPSRNIDKYSETLTMNQKNPAFVEETKEQVHYLHLLRES